MAACNTGALTPGQRAQVNAMQMTFPSVYQDAEHGIETRYPNWQTDETQKAARELKLQTLNEFGAALSSLHGEANQ